MNTSKRLIMTIAYSGLPKVTTPEQLRAINQIKIWGIYGYEC